VRMGAFRYLARKAETAAKRTVLWRRTALAAKEGGPDKLLSRRGADAAIEVLDKLLSDGREDEASRLLTSLSGEGALRVMEGWCRGSEYDDAVLGLCLSACRSMAEEALRKEGSLGIRSASEQGPYRGSGIMAQGELEAIAYLEQASGRDGDGPVAEAAARWRRIVGIRRVTEEGDRMRGIAGQRLGLSDTEPVVWKGHLEDDFIREFIGEWRARGFDEDCIDAIVERSGLIERIGEILGARDRERRTGSKEIDRKHERSSMTIHSVGQFETTTITITMEDEFETVCMWGARSMAQALLVSAGRHAINALAKRAAGGDGVDAWRALRALERISERSEDERTRRKAHDALAWARERRKGEPEADSEPGPMRRRTERREEHLTSIKKSY